MHGVLNILAQPYYMTSPLCTFLFILLMVAIVLMIIKAGGSDRRLQGSQRICPNCREASPRFAQFCRRCGQKLL
jgi:ribosomal protein L40E